MTLAYVQRVPSSSSQSEPETVPLYSCKGRVKSVRDFAGAHAQLLELDERDLLLEHIPRLASSEAVPPVLHKCLTRSSRLATHDPYTLTARRSGVRSAFLPDKMLQLKGCRPQVDNADFPVESLPFGTNKILRERIPFGVMTAEAVTREILGFCFMQEHGLSYQATPMCVWEYLSGATSLGYCLVATVTSEIRVESFVEDPGCTVGELIASQKPGAPNTSRLIVGSELKLHGLNLWSYLEAKTRLVCDMHFRGGFRGILNSNIGNDVVLANGRGRTKIVLCDFDTFFLVHVPASPDAVFLDGFILQCLVEVIIGSLPILQYVELPDRCSVADRADALGAVYFTKSSLWRAYHRRFFANAKALGWNLSMVEESLERVRRTEACADVLSSRVLNNYYFERMGRERTIYFLHN